MMSDSPAPAGAARDARDPRLPERPPPEAAGVVVVEEKPHSVSKGGVSQGGAGASVRSDLDGKNFTFDGVPRYGPDGMPLGKPKAKAKGGGAKHEVIVEEKASGSGAEHHHGIEVHHHGVELENEGEGGWYRAESGRLEQQRKAWVLLAAIAAAVDRAWQLGDCPEKRWTNDPEEVDDQFFQEVVPFPPNDAQRHVPHERRQEPRAAAHQASATQPPPPQQQQQQPPLQVHRKKKGGCAECGWGGGGRHQGGAGDPYDSPPDFGTPRGTPRRSGICDACGHDNRRAEHGAHDHHSAHGTPAATTPAVTTPAVTEAADSIEGHDEAAHESVAKVRPWVRLLSFAQTCGPGCSGACSVMPEMHQGVTHCGRVFQGELDNGYLVEALNAISLRPKLVQQLFHCWDMDRSIYVVSLFKNGTWTRVEIDDYVPAGKGSNTYCCRSEYFPNVLWPTLVEKAYAKACTVRSPDIYYDTGGWEAVGGGGQVDEALADLTGGVAGSFSTTDVSPDRLFIYLHALQREALFVCRVHVGNCAKNGVVLNPYAHHAVNRAAHVEGACYVQVFCAHAAGVHSGGLDNLSVPASLWKLFPEKVGEGFTWMSIYDFHTYFDVIFECRLVNSPDVGIEGMPPPRHEHLPSLPAPLQPPFAAPLHPGATLAGLPGPPGSMLGPGVGPALPFKEEPLFCEWVFANAGAVTERCPPEFTVSCPQALCEVIATVEQTDTRITQLGAKRKAHTAVLLKVYQHIRGDAYSSELVCKSNWMPVRGAMVAFKSTKGGKFKIVAEMRSGARCDRLVFRCYTSHPGAIVSAGSSLRKHLLALPEELPLGLKWSFVGAVPPERLARADEPWQPPPDLDELKRQYGEQKCAVM